MKPRYTVGIDLGTTHTVVAYAPFATSGASKAPAIRLFPIEQLVAPGEVAALPLLASVRYHPAPGELADGEQQLPWPAWPEPAPEPALVSAEVAGASGEGGEDGNRAAPAPVIGRLARQLGAQVPGRLVSSAKSWLSHATVDRLAPILPWGAAADVDHQHQPGRRQFSVQAAAVAKQPVVKRRLGFFQQAQPGQPGHPRGLQRQGARALVEGGRHGQHQILLRQLFDALWQRARGRRRSAGHERAWLNLAGYCLRPGCGDALDGWRLQQLWSLFPAGVQHGSDHQVCAEWWTLWRRVAGGLDPSQQLRLLDDFAFNLHINEEGAEPGTPRPVRAFR